MKRTGLVLAFVAVIGLATAHASKPFESHFWIADEADGEWEDLWLPTAWLHFQP